MKLLFYAFIGFFLLLSSCNSDTNEEELSKEEPKIEGIKMHVNIIDLTNSEEDLLLFLFNTSGQLVDSTTVEVGTTAIFDIKELGNYRLQAGNGMNTSFSKKPLLFGEEKVYVHDPEHTILATIEVGHKHLNKRLKISSTAMINKYVKDLEFVFHGDLEPISFTTEDTIYTSLEEVDLEVKYELNEKPVSFFISKQLKRYFNDYYVTRHNEMEEQIERIIIDDYIFHTSSIDVSEVTTSFTSRFGMGFTFSPSMAYQVFGIGQYENWIEAYDGNQVYHYDFEWNKSFLPCFINANYVNDKLYIFNHNGTSSKNGPSDKNTPMVIYDLKSKTSEVVQTTETLKSYAGSVVVGNEIFYMGGRNYEEERATLAYSSEMKSFNTETHQWTTYKDMPHNFEARANVLGNTIYTFGGYNKQPLNSIYKFDVKNNEWELEAELPYSLSAVSTSVYEGKIWIVGDYEELNYLGCFDPENRVLTQYTNKDFVGRRHAGSAILNDALYIFGGNTSPTSAPVKTVQKIDLQSFK
ncbi:kelch repeat-containing protein [Flammeovirga sp. SJP92]|uniref:Kelch repeat-containing protein n=1 Tax=Flammeovirga sp. SJP92 TaxID=1775430 RepID=UPI000787E216|nr:kelch repeat-containing protein [Flammeovirga sp. SJP92]KXX66835.1 hypothetical protein AVL50_30345 [Flammeovirga sp. SJP92]